MVYAGYGPGHKVAEPISEFEECLRKIPLDCFELTLGILEKIIRNTAQTPSEAKYRTIR
jgi:hypothetical protein